MSRSSPLSVRWSVLASLMALTLSTSVVHAAGAAGCKGFKSGSYVALNAHESDDVWRANIIEFNADTLTVTDADGTTQLSAASQTCAFTLPSGDPLVVSPAGLFTARLSADKAMVLGLPLQSVSLAKLAGTWNYLRNARLDDGLWHTMNGQVIVKRNGRLSASTCWADGSNCAAPMDVGTLVANPAGGYDLTKAEGVVDRFFALRNKDGQMMLAGVGVGVGESALTVAAPVLALGLPTVGDKSAAWDISVNPSGQPSALGSGSFKVLQVDTANSSYTRKRLEDCRRDTWQVNHGRDGMSYRDLTPFTRCDGSTGTANKNLSLSLRQGFGLAAFGWESTDDTEARYFGLSISQP
jgi:hypothetical protein